MDTKKRNLLIGAAAVVLILLVVFLVGMNIGKKSEMTKSEELNIIEEPSETLPDFELKEYEVTVDYGTQMSTNFDDYLTINNPDTTYDIEILKKFINPSTNEDEYKLIGNISTFDGTFDYPGTYYIRFFNYNTEEFLTVHWNLDVTFSLVNSNELKNYISSDEDYQSFLIHLQYLLCRYNDKYSTNFQNIIFDTDSILKESDSKIEANFYIEDEMANSYFEISCDFNNDSYSRKYKSILWKDDFYITDYYISEYK